MKEQRRLALLVLAMAGVLISHTLGYGIAHIDTAGRAEALRDHGYLAVVSWLVVPAALVAVGWLAVRTVRAAGPHVVISRQRFTFLVLGLLGFQEVAERLVAGAAGDLLHEPGVWCSAAVAVVVASILVGLVRTAARVVRRFARRRDPAPKAPVSWPLPSPLVLSARPVGSAIAVRGPPLAPRF